MDNYLDRLNHNIYYYLGYPIPCDIEYSQHAELLNHCMNNLGDPYANVNAFSCHQHEAAVIDFYKQLYKLPKDEFWGYIASGSTESILYCVWRAREILKVHNRPIKIICNTFAHYAIDKVAQIVNLELIKISADCFGSMNLTELETIIDHRQHNSYIVFASIGSTLTSSIDDISKIKPLFRNIPHFIHADGASDGHFLPMTDEFSKIEGLVDSLNISGHKFLGCPMPAGITIIKKDYVTSAYTEIVKCLDVTLGGSRNGLSPYLLYHRIKEIGGMKGLRDRYLKCREDADRYLEIFQAHGINAFKFPNAITVVLIDVPKELLKKWLAPSVGNLITLTAYPGKLTDTKIHEFISDVKKHEQGIFVVESKYEFPSPVEPLFVFEQEDVEDAPVSRTSTCDDRSTCNPLKA